MVHTKEQDHISLLVINEEQEGVVGNEICMEKRSGRAETKKSSCSSSFATFLIDLNEGLVDGGVQTQLVSNVAVLMFEVQEIPQV